MAETSKISPILAINLKPRNKLKTGITGIDNTLEGGLPTNGIIEVCGESASGKSQLCLQLSLTVQLENSNQHQRGSVIYICTEDVFPSKRLQQMIRTYKADYDLGSNIFIEHAADFQSLKECLTRKVPKLQQERKVKLLIIDSVAALFRGTYGASEGNARTQDLRALGGMLLALNSTYGMCVLCVNQVTACFTREGNVAALGLAWSNIVSTRIQLLRHSGPVRSFQVLFSPNIQKLQTFFAITEKGLEDCDGLR